MQKLLEFIFDVNGCAVTKVTQNETSVIARVRLTKGDACSCGICGRKGKLYDNGRKRRNWRTTDIGLFKAYIEMDSYRIQCPKCGVHTVRAPWANAKSGFTEAFAQQIALSTTHFCKLPHN